MVDGDGIQRLVRGHQARLLLDTNMLLVHAALKVDAAYPARFRRTTRVPDECVEVVAHPGAAAERWTKLVTTPHVFTEATNLVGEGMAKDDEHGRLKEVLRRFALHQPELTVVSRSVAAGGLFTRLGLADAALTSIGGRRPPLVLTDDLDLARELQLRQRPVAKVEHYAFPAASYE